MNQCAYCHQISNTRDHVIPNCLYPKMHAYANIQRITVPACSLCNARWSDDESHFRTMITLAGEPGVAQDAHWKTAMRSFNALDGERRKRDIIQEFTEIASDNDRLTMIFPGNDQRVLSIVRKVVRGLSYYHKIAPQLSEKRILANIMPHKIPEKFKSELIQCDRGSDICSYRYVVLENYDSDLHSAWFIKFLGRVEFFGFVSKSDDGFIIEKNHDNT